MHKGVSLNFNIAFLAFWLASSTSVDSFVMKMYKVMMWNIKADFDNTRLAHFSAVKAVLFGAL